MAKNLFDILPVDFYKPLISKYRRMYADCILLIFNTFKPEISYGVNRDTVAKVLIDYFEADDDEITFRIPNDWNPFVQKSNRCFINMGNLQNGKRSLLSAA